MATTTTAWPLRVSANGRYLTDCQGTPWFYLCDTAWQLLGRVRDVEVAAREPFCTSEQQMRLYMDDRAARGFNVIHCPLLNEFDPAKARAALDKPDEAFFDRCLMYIDYARSRGLAMHLIPAWMGARGQKWWQVFKDLPEADVRRFVRCVVRRFAGYDNIIWSVGGDFGPPDDHAVEVSCWMGEELKQNTDALVTFFTQGSHSSSEWFHDQPWLDFNFVQVKTPDSPRQHLAIIGDYGRTPAKPTHLGEDAYEYELEGQVWPKVEARQIRSSAWRTVLAGGFGYTYGRRGLWAFNDTAAGLGVRYIIHKPWEDLLQPDRSPGCQDVCRMAALMRSLAWEKLIPEHANGFATSGVDRDTAHYTASACASDGTFALAYFPTTKSSSFDLSRMAGPAVTADWFDPASGACRPSAGSPFAKAVQEFAPPGPNAAGAEDWVLVLQAR